MLFFLTIKKVSVWSLFNAMLSPSDKNGGSNCYTLAINFEFLIFFSIALVSYQLHFKAITFHGVTIMPMLVVEFYETLGRDFANSL